MSILDATDPMPEPQHDGFRSWLQAWVAPPTLISLIAFGSMTAVAHYRLGKAEIAIEEIHASMQRDRDYSSNVYQRRDVLVEQLKQIQSQLDEIRIELRDRRRFEPRP